MVFLVSVFSVFGSFLYFSAFKRSNYQSDALLLGFIVCIAFFVFGFSILQLREKINEQKDEIEKLKQQIIVPKNTSTDNTTNEDSKKKRVNTR